MTEKLEPKRTPPVRYHVIRLRLGDDFKTEVARRRAAGEIAPHDLVVGILKFGIGPSSSGQAPQRT